MPYTSAGKDILNKLAATIHLMGDKPEIGIPLDRGHKMIMLMVEDKPP